MQAKALLQERFGFSEFRGGQEKVIQALLDGHSAAAIFPTGSGKSLCYQLPALALPHLTVVVSPLLALIQDQISFLQSKGIPATRIDSSLAPGEGAQIADGLRHGEYKILFISVERFKNERFRNFLAQLPLSLLVVDEAHCISEWGHNFRPDYLKLPEYRKSFNFPQVLLLTATATPKVIDDMSKKFDIAQEHVNITGFYRPNLHLHVLPVELEERNNMLHRLLARPAAKPGIVYVTLQKTAEEVADYLQLQNINAVAYHAGMAPEKRRELQNAFMQGDIDFVVATIAFGMGIDKGNIRSVIHYDFPKSIENYSQEIGRAGRDGQVSNCVVLGNLANMNVLENFVYGDTPEQESIAYILRKIKESGPEWHLRIYQLSTDSNIRQLTLKTLLVYLEAQGIIEPRSSYYGEYRFKPSKSRESIVDQFSGEHREFVNALFRFSTKGRLWYTLNFDNLLANYPADRSRILKALEYLEEKGDVQLEAKQMTEVYAVHRTDFDPEEAGKAIHAIFAHKEEAEIHRLHDTVALFETDTCLSKRLSEYFGEKTDWERCGTCSVCLKGGITLPKAVQEAPLSSFDFAQNREDLKKLLKRQPSAREQALFLTGMKTPRFSRLRKRAKAAYAELENYPFAEVLEYCEQR